MLQTPTQDRIAKRDLAQLQAHDSFMSDLLYRVLTGDEQAANTLAQTLRRQASLRGLDLSQSEYRRAAKALAASLGFDDHLDRLKIAHRAFPSNSEASDEFSARQWRLRMRHQSAD